MIEFILKDFPHVSMLQSSAEEIFAIIGRKIDKQGAMLVEDIKIYLNKIQNAIFEDEKHAEQEKKTDKDEYINNQKTVTLKQKSYPLRDLMAHAIENHETIIYNKL
jgi:NADPH-dependent 7-cyano-7-deazaguanine reductase QueF-like protein